MRATDFRVAMKHLQQLGFRYGGRLGRTLGPYSDFRRQHRLRVYYGQAECLVDFELRTRRASPGLGRGYMLVYASREASISRVVVHYIFCTSREERDSIRQEYTPFTETAVVKYEPEKWFI